MEPDSPPGVTLRALDDFTSLRTNIFDKVKTNMQKAFPISHGDVRIELHDVDYEELDDVPISKQKQMMLENRYITKKLRGTVKLFDNKSNNLIEEKRLSLLRVPYLTERGTFVHNGSEYSSISQARLLPGVYTRRQSNGGLESHFVVKPGTGVGFRVGFEPDTAQYKVKISQANLHMYSLLKDIGTDDAELEKAWGSDIFKANQAKYDSRVFDKAYDRLVPTRLKKLDKSQEDRIASVKKALEAAQIHARVAQKNLPNMFNTKVAAEWQARWEGQKAMEKVASIPFNPDLTAEEVAYEFFDDMYKYAGVYDINTLIKAKGHSDKKQYAAKNSVMAAMMHSNPDEFIVDSDNGKYLGITHTPTGFKMHLPRTVVPAAIQVGTLDKSASLEDDFDPDLDADDLTDVYNAIYGKVGPRLAGMKKWKDSWIPENSLGWVAWYRDYSNGTRTEGDDKQIQRWKSFKARQVPRFLANPTPRMLASLRNWAIDGLLLIKDEDKREQLKKDMEEYKAKAWEEYKEGKK